MLSGSSKFILNEQNVLPMSVESSLYFSGFVGFAVISTAKTHVEHLLEDPSLKKMPGQVLFVTEAKGPKGLESYTPQAISDLYACARHLEKMVIHGALTNGNKWIFFFLKLGEGGSGGKYFQSKVITIMQFDKTSLAL